MASPDTQSDVFKFVALRPPSPPSGDSATLNFIRDDRQPRETPVGIFLSQFNSENVRTFPEKLRSFIAEKNYSLSFPQDRGDRTFDQVVSSTAAVPVGSISTATLKAAVEAATGQSLSALVTSSAAVAMRHTLWDCYYAFYLLSGVEGQDLATLTNHLRTGHLLARLNAGQPVPGDATFKAILAATPVVDKLFTTLPKPTAPPPTPADTPLTDSQKQAFKDLWKELLDTHQAIQDSRGIAVIAKTQKSTAKLPTVSVPVRTRGAAVEAASAADSTISRTTMDLKMAVDPEAFKALPATTQAALAAVRMTALNFSRPEAVAKLSGHLESLYNSMAATSDVRVLDFMPAIALQVPGVLALTERLKQLKFIPNFNLPFPLLNDNVRGEIRPLGVGDLKVVKQKLVSYQPGEVAHIENVLRGEYKERRYRVLDRTEQTTDITTQTTEEQSRDTQTTERFELKKESENTIQQQMSVQAGVTVSGSYGMVTFGAHGDFAYSTSSQESNKSSSNFAREVVDKSVTRIQKSVRQQQITKQLHEVEELDTHGLDNKGQPDNLTGVYRWVDKYYLAQIYNYGKRMMFEFIVPEPAAFYGYVQTRPSKTDIQPPPTLPPGLTHKSITDYNFQNYVRDYQIQGCTPPPAYSKVVSTSLSSDAKIDDGTPLSKSSKDLVVPEGYVCDSLAVSLSFVHAKYPQFRLSVGVDNFWYSYTTTGGSGREKVDWASGATSVFDGIIPVSIDMYDVNSYFVNVVASCVRTDLAYELWQIHTFEKIMAAYQALKATYDQQIAQQQSQQGVAIHGKNPGINRQIEKIELKKSCVKLLMDTWQFGSFSAMKQFGNNPPDFEIHQAVAEGKVSQFFEQAFEWENTTYLFYPYFWGRQSQWIQKSSDFDEDPLFTQFLQAGAARVVVPVHPAYNDAVMYFLENNGAIWNGGSPPRLNDPMYISLADELRGQTDDLANAVAEGDPWQVILPTTLVYLQKDATLPTFP
jgi:hypothetical protein